MARYHVKVDEGVVFGTGGGRDLRCDVFRPEGPDEPAPGVLLVHGGGWRSGDRTQLRGYGVLLGREGYVCVAPEYRLAPGAAWPAMIHDVKAAVRWMRSEAGELGIDPERIAVEGNSAGAHLALLVAGTRGLGDFEGDGGSPGVATDVAAVIAVYAPTRLPGLPGKILGEPGELDGVNRLDSQHDDVLKASPLTHVTPAFPPTMLIHGAADTLVPVESSIQMFEALRAAGVPTELHVYADTPHGFDAEPRFGRQCAAEMTLFLDRYVRARTATAAP